MKRAFVSISTPSHLPQVKVLADSLRRNGPDLPFFVWVAGKLPTNAVPGLELRSVEELDSEPGRSIRTKYASGSDELRWSLKPVVLLELLAEGFDQVIYLDNDLCFFGEWEWLFEELNGKTVLLSPHWRIADPEVDAPWFETNFKDGIYNAGFLGTSAAGIPALRWWAKACAYACEKSPERGLWDDQRYLDLIPAHFPPAGILTHRGCNVAYWNQRVNLRSRREGKLWLNDLDSLVFVHFTADLMRSIEEGQDAQLGPELAQYRTWLTAASL